jgi:hypothetical protein
MKYLIFLIFLHSPLVHSRDLAEKELHKLENEAGKWIEQANKQNELIRKSSPLERGKGIVEKIPNIPGAGYLKNIVEDYQRILKPELYKDPRNVGGSNKGIIEFITKEIEKNPDLAARAKAFYDDIAKLDKQQPHLQQSETRPLGSRASIADNASNVHSGNLKQPFLGEGWLWKLALYHANNDPNDAMKLIGLCGHDDVAQGNAKIQLSPKMAKENFENWLKKTNDLIAMYESSLAQKEKQLMQLKPPSIEFKQMVDQKKNEIAALNMSIENLKIAVKNPNQELFQYESIECPEPRNSLFFLPQSLGSDVDIPLELKKRIVKAQAPSDLNGKRAPGASIPAKHYHVYGSALVACEMISKGYPPRLVSKISALLAYAYRTERMNTIARNAIVMDVGNVPPYMKMQAASLLSNFSTLTAEEIGIQYDNFLKNKESFSVFNGKAGSAFSGPSSNSNASVGAQQLNWNNAKSLGSKDQKSKVFADPSSVKETPGSFEVAMENFTDYLVNLGEVSGTLYDQDFKDLALYSEYQQILSPSGMSGDKMINFPIPPDPMGMNRESYIKAFLQYQKNQEHYYVQFTENMKKSVETQIQKTSELKDAVELFRLWTLSEKISLLGKEIDIPFTNVRMPLPNFAKDTFYERLVRVRPKGWSKERFEKAEKRFNSMLVDWEWTVKQHEIGGEFARKNCNAKNPIKTPAQAAEEVPMPNTTNVQ